MSDTISMLMWWFLKGLLEKKVKYNSVKDMQKDFKILLWFVEECALIRLASLGQNPQKENPTALFQLSNTAADR